MVYFLWYRVFLRYDFDLKTDLFKVYLISQNFPETKMRYYNGVYIIALNIVPGVP